MVDSNEMTPQAIAEIGLWESEFSHRHYYKVSKSLRVKSAEIILGVI